MPRKSSADPASGFAGGILLVDKPSGWTSHDVVNFIRGFAVGKVGHCGTLDPDATGLLVILIGKATKLSESLHADDKTYSGEMRLGIETATQDASGAIISQKDYDKINQPRILEAFARFTGKLMQIPPMVSAKKVEGQPLYKLARKGIVVERDPVPIRIFNLLVDQIDLPIIAFTVKCSKGTYVRTLCADIGAVLGCGAHLQSLRRLQSGRFSVSASHPIAEIRTWDRDRLIAHCLPIEQVLI